MILCADDAGPLAALQARRAGADRFLPNPVEAQTLRRCMRPEYPASAQG